MRVTRIVPVLLVVTALAVAGCSSDRTAAAGRPGHGDEDTKSTSTTKPHTHSMKGMTAAEHAAMMKESAAADDRGFAELENGEQHSHAFTQPVSKMERALLAHQMELARETAMRYPTVADALAAGLHRAGPFAPGLGAHYVNYANGGGSPDGVMTDDAIGKPLAWIYDGTHPDSRVTGLFYMTGVKDPEGFAGDNDVWHVHRDICITRAADGGVDAPLGADRGATKKECDSVGGTLLRKTQYLLHVWPVPGYESPEGVFSHLSSAVTCDDGTYYMIKNVKKVGTRTTACRDGSE